MPNPSMEIYSILFLGKPVAELLQTCWLCKTTYTVCTAFIFISYPHSSLDKTLLAASANRHAQQMKSREDSDKHEDQS